MRLPLSIALALSFVLPNIGLGQTPIRILFLGDKGHHQPELRFRQLQPVLEQRGIELSYTETVDSLNDKTLSKYDGLMVYANTTKITPSQEKALLDFVASGKGFIPLHCASYCFLNSEKYIGLVGAQFKSHGTGTFRTIIAEPSHPIMKGFAGFESFDETYVHAKHNAKDRIVLEYRAEKKTKEPWTWVRTHGKGRVFYTAWGHDERTWGNRGFHDLVERGILWAVNRPLTRLSSSFRDDPTMTAKHTDVKPFEYQDAKIPFYAPKAGAKGPLTRMQLPLPVDESMKHFVHPTDFLLKRFASDPQIKRPICMNWDERGRLWIVESVDYPNNLQRNGDGSDRLVICEDTDGDGVADKFTTFADKLSIPTSFIFAHGGVVLISAPNVWFLKSSKGDDVCDSRAILFTGWGAGDTHAGPSNLHYGFDNWIYGIVGYSGFNGTVAGESHKFGQGFFRFKIQNEPEASATDKRVKCTKLEFLRSTSNNSWGVGWSEDGLLFGSTANGNPSVFMPIPNRYYEKVKGLSASVLPTIAQSNKINPITDKVRQVDWHGGFTAAAGHALYTARTYPKEYWNRTAFVAEPTGHLIATFVLARVGSNFSSRNAWSLLASDDEWSAPIMAEVGPDGCVWVIDWYNFIVQHNPTPPGFKNGKGNAYETPLRDKVHGRIYRLEPANVDDKKLARINLQGATAEQLVAALKSDNMFWRKQAQRLLVERGKTDVAAELVKLVNDPSVDEIGLNTAAIHSLWTLRGLNADHNEDRAIVSSALRKAVSHPSAGVRRAALAVLMPSGETANIIGKSGVLDDRDPHVRIAAFLALAQIPQHGEPAGRALVEAARKPANLADRWLRDAVVMAAAGDPQAFLAYQTAQAEPPSPTYLDIVRAVAAHHAAMKDSRPESTLSGLAKAHPDVIEAVLDGYLKGSKARTVENSATVSRNLSDLMLTLPAAGRGKGIRLAKLWNVAGFEQQIAEIGKTLLAVVLDGKQSDARRVDAAKQLIDSQFDDAKGLTQMLDTITPRTSPELAIGLVEAIGGASSPEVGVLLLKRLTTFTPQVRASALRTLLSRQETTRQFLDAVEKGTLTFSELPLDQKQALTAHPDKQIASRAKALLAKGGGLPNADRQKVVEEFLPLLKRKGDVALGKAIFKKHCAICHTHSGDGTKIGPDLSGVAVHTNEHLLIDILDPSRSVEGNYRVYTVETKQGKVLSGLLASETKTTIELFNTDGKKLVVERDDIESLAASTKSLMPEGFEKQVKQEELIDLLTFLTARGKFVPILLDKAATIDSTQGMFFSKAATVERLILPDWSPRTVKGVPFHFVDPVKNAGPNAIMLYSKNGPVSATMPKSAKLDCNMPARAIHLLSGVSGWGFPYGKEGGVTLIVRLHYADGKTEDHALKNGEHFADYIRKVDVPRSEFAFMMRSQQMRYLSITPGRDAELRAIEFVKGPDQSAPIVLAVTVETK
ncbi:MAG: c-type cytochrome [Gemmataceae bacterium]|nr:c-type cytochrome [Gemmataceae bacterium]